MTKKPAFPEKIAKWQGYIPDDELATYAKARFGQRIGMGTKAALLNVDTTWMFVDPAYALCGKKDDKLHAALVRVTETFRRLDLPIYYSRRDDRSHPTYRGIWNLKLGTSDEFQYTSDPRADQWPEDYAPRQQDRIVLKNKPSCFFGTPLDSFLRYDSVDTLIVVGVSTSGCVRAAVNDAFNYSFRAIVPTECCGDRSPQAHKASLFDMDMKMADVESLDYVVAELEARFGKGKGKGVRAAAE